MDIDSGQKIAYAKSYLRRKYDGDLPGLRSLADQIAESSFESVTVTGTAFEGASSQGQLVFHPLEYLGALEELIAEMSTASAATPSRNIMVMADFSSGIATT